MHKKVWKRIFHDIPLRAKMCCIFFVLLVIPMGCFSVYTTNRIQAVMQEQTFAAAKKTFDETYLSLSSLSAKMENVSEILADDTLLYDVISPFHPKRYTDYLTMAIKVSQLKTLSGVDGIRVYNESQYFSQPMGDIEQAQWYADLLRNPGRLWLTPADFYDHTEEDQPYFSFVYLLFHPDNYMKTKAVLRVDVLQSVLEQSLNKTSVTPNGIMLLFTEEQVLLTSNGNNPVSDAKTLSLLLAVDENQWSDVTFEGRGYHVLSSVIQPAGWRLATLIPVTDITSVRNQIFLEMICVMLALVGIGYVLALLLADSVLKRVKQLATAMNNLQAGNADILIDDTSQDEVGQLVYCFNLMASRINKLMDEKVQYGQDIKTLEMRALQAQINPHFLYNTLDTINCIAIQKGMPEISNIVSSLALFYKISLSKGKERILIREEIAHAQMYINILGSRFPNKIQTFWDISPEIENLHIIKILLQPIIENAAIHGIYEKETGTGTIRIKGWLEEKDVYITVEDDGTGMTQDVIDANFYSDSQTINQKGGYGIQNIRSRIRIAYGPEFGLTCVSAVGIGTKVTIHIPKCP